MKKDNLGHEDKNVEFKESTTELEDGIIALSAIERIGSKNQTDGR